MPSPAMVLRSCLIDLGLVCYPTVNSALPPCYVSAMPDDPDVMVAIYDVQGRMFGRDTRTGKNLIHYGAVLKTRSLTYAGYDLALAIAVAMDQNFPLTTTLSDEDGGGVYGIQNIRRVTQVISLGEEIGTKRQFWSIDVRMPFAQEQSTIG